MSGTGNFLLDQVLGALKVSPEQIKAVVGNAEARLVKLETDVASVLAGIGTLSANLEKVLVALENEAPVVEKAVHDAFVTQPVPTPAEAAAPAPAEAAAPAQAAPSAPAEPATTAKVE